jgi:isocitrate dehydrogenase kinase/phosphatase
MYRDLLHHLAYTNDEFEIARGERGMVMIVFTLPTYEPRLG